MVSNMVRNMVRNICFIATKFFLRYVEHKCQAVDVLGVGSFFVIHWMLGAVHRKKGLWLVGLCRG